LDEDAFDQCSLQDLLTGELESEIFPTRLHVKIEERGSDSNFPRHAAFASCPYNKWTEPNGWTTVGHVQGLGMAAQVHTNAHHR
jgi:hypothetical protein